MNRKNLTAAVLAGLAGAAGIAGSAQAVNLNPDGLGQVLIYPYYTTQGGNQTLLTVVNTTDDAKAVKVRFLEGKNSVEVLDFNLYLSPWDVWVGAVLDGGVIDAAEAGNPHLLVADNSCTVPYLWEGTPATTAPGLQRFLTVALPDSDDDTSVARTAEGHLEMIEMGTLTDEYFDTATAVTHVDGTPADCGQLVDAWTDNTNPGAAGYWMIDWYTSGNNDWAEGDDRFGYRDITAPSGGLFGGAAIINVDAGTMYSYDARAVNGFFADSALQLGNPADYAALHARPGLETPSLNSGNVFTGYAYLDNQVDPTSYTFEDAVDAMSYVFMHDQIMNEYTTEDAVGAQTEWVVTFPTKNWYVNDKLVLLPWNPEDDNPGYRPFVSEWDGDVACEPVTLNNVWDRDERPITGPEEPGGTPIPPVVSPSTPDEFGEDPVLPFSLCYETQVIRFGTYAGADNDPPAAYAGPTEILGSNNVVNINNEIAGANFQYGWARIDLLNYKIDDNSVAFPGNPDGVIGDADTPRQRFDLGGVGGLPVTGFSVQRYQNSFLNGGSVLANYGGIFNHKGTRTAFEGGGPVVDRELR